MPLYASHLWILESLVSHSQSIAMMPSQPVPVSFLDILFAHRNKAYGAYALRVSYERRLWISLGAALLAAGVFVLIALLYKPADKGSYFKEDMGLTVLFDETVLPTPPPPSQPEPKTSTAASVAREKYNTLQLVPDHLADPAMVDIAGLTDVQIGNFSTSAEGGDVGLPVNNAAGSGEIQSAAAQVSKPFIPDQREPEFPGGQEALVRFLQQYLVIPDELAAGDRKMVRARFMVDAQGMVSLVEIAESAGNVFDREVIRVCKKMPKWKPAIQNGVPVSRSYVLPVTFVGVEQ